MATIAAPLAAPQTVHLNAMSSDLRFMLSEADVPEQLQWRISQLGYKAAATFAVWGDDRAAVRAAIAADVLDPSDAALNAAQQTAARTLGNYILSAWIVASQRSVEQARLTTESKLLRLPTIMSRTTLTALRQRYQDEFGRVPDTIWPCAALIEHRMEEIEDGDIVATPLGEIIAVDRCADETTTISEVGSSVKVRKSPKAIAPPATTEEFRCRFRTLAISYVLASYKHSSRLWLRTATMANWQIFVEYVLSDEVGNYALDTEGISIRASWSTTLSYEFQMRKLICRKIQFDMMDFATAMREAMQDLTIKERYFITPTAYLSAAKKTNNSTALTTNLAASPGGQIKGLGKGGQLSRKQKRAIDSSTAASSVTKSSKGKAKGKGKGKARKTPDGRVICIAFNTSAGCSYPNCKFVHVCSTCFAEAHNCLACSGA